ncbi:MAG: hypothetical protein ACFFD2_07915 [Promethearchaeota archaeon]
MTKISNPRRYWFLKQIYSYNACFEMENEVAKIHKNKKEKH